MHEDIKNNLQDPIPNKSRLSMIFNTAKQAYETPENAQLVSELGDLSSFFALIRIREKMRQDETGKRILKEQPRIKDFDTYNID